MISDRQDTQPAKPPLPLPLLQLVRRSPVTVFVVGGGAREREAAARRLHQESVVHDGAFVAVDCEAEDERTRLHRALEAWLSGSTAAGETDLLADTSGGTLFVDAIEKLPLASQRLLLGLALQRRERGSHPDRLRWAARLIVGNERDLTDALAAGRIHIALYDLVDRYRVDLG